MKKLLSSLSVVTFIIVVALAPYASSQEAEPAGKKIFLDQKCNVCHSIDSMSITKKTATSKAPDLSDLGSTQSAEWIAKFITKEEKLNNKAHPKPWTGKKEDLTTLSTWLASLKKAK
jgi:mono/diheme cytochrome c family protein